MGQVVEFVMVGCTALFLFGVVLWSREGLTVVDFFDWIADRKDLAGVLRERQARRDRDRLKGRQ